MPAMNDNPSASGSPKRPEMKNLGQKPPVRKSIAPDVEVQPPPKSSGGSGQNLPTVQRQGWVSKVLGRSRRDQQIQTLQSGYVEMLDMMRSITNHLDRQAQGQDQLLKTLDHFPDAVEGLRNVGKATEQQTEVLGMVRTQLETNAAHEHEIIKSMEGFNKTLNLMDETSRNTASTIGDLVESTRDSEDELRAMLERSEKRSALLTGILGVIGLLAIGSALYVGLSQRQPAPGEISSAPAITGVETGDGMAIGEAHTIAGVTIVEEEEISVDPEVVAEPGAEESDVEVPEMEVVPEVADPAPEVIWDEVPEQATFSRMHPPRPRDIAGNTRGGVAAKR